MTDREKAIVMAYTGICMLEGEKFNIFHKYVEEIMGRPVYTHEMGVKAVDDEIKEKAKPDFLELCKNTTQESEDCISRQAVMDCFKKWQPYMATRLWDFEKELSALPPVTPKQREDATKYFKNVYELSQTLGVSYDFVDEKIKEILKAGGEQNE